MNIALGSGASSFRTSIKAFRSTEDFEQQKNEFMNCLFTAHRDKGIPIRKLPIIGHQELDLYKLFLLVEEFQGLKNVIKKKQFKQIGKRLGISDRVTNVGYVLRTKYNQFISPVEDLLREKFLTHEPPNVTDSLPFFAQTPLAIPGALAEPPGALEAPPETEAPRSTSSSSAFSSTKRPLGGADFTFADVSKQRKTNGPTVLCPGCGQSVPLRGFQAHLFDCNLDFYIDCFGVSHPNWARVSVERAVREVSAAPGTPQPLPNLPAMLQNERQVDTQEIVDIFAHLARKERRKSKLESSSSSPFSERDAPQRGFRKHVSPLLVHGKARKMIQFPPKRPLMKSGAQYPFAAAPAPSYLDGLRADGAPADPLSELVACAVQHIFHGSGSVRMMNKLIGDSQFVSEKVTDGLFLKTTHRFLSMFTPATLFAVVQHWPYRTLALIGLPHVTEEFFASLRLSPHVRNLEVGALPPGVVFERWPAQGTPRLAELQLTGWSTVTPAAIENALGRFPNLETLRVQSAFELDTWPLRLRDAGRFWFASTGAPPPVQHGEMASGVPFPGFRLQEVALLDLHPFFNLGMLAEAAPNLERCRLVYATQPEYSLPEEDLERRFNFKKHDYSLRYPQFLEAARGDGGEGFKALFPHGLPWAHPEPTPDVQPLTAEDPRGPPPLGFFAPTPLCEVGDASSPGGDASPSGERTEIPFEPTFRELLPLQPPAFYGMQAMRRLVYLRVEGRVSIDLLSFLSWVPQLEEVELRGCSFAEFCFWRISRYLNAAQRGKLQAMFQRGAHGVGKHGGAHHMHEHMSSMPPSPPPPPSCGGEGSNFIKQRPFTFLLHLFLVNLKRISFADCNGRFFDQKLHESRSFHECSFA
eukprot:gnl/Chilomastix_cuspidata/4006.p1 GENE.gnl/Chilomastix_cuspidata/4006~~gnl/Chilomastix_cuspidata/4006.p1  ORF type:complete len:880 (-),score=336.83 gnl/Chilomastix_cuspidata/4006:539-3139(-)